jgi:diguanylate cyclase (GGDEF)-like protein/PAS domain S-box-containing protein
MQDKRTKKELIEELSALHRQIDDLKKFMTLFGPEKDVFEVIGNSIQAGIYIIQDGKTIFVNEHMSSYSGYSREELLNLSLMQDTVHPEDQVRVRECGIKMLKGEDLAPYEYHILCKDGSIKWLMEKVASIKYRGQRAVLGNTMDVTDKKRIEDELRDIKAKLEIRIQERTSELLASNEALKESEERYRTLVEYATDIVFRTDENGHFTFVNPATLRITGYDEEEIIGKQYTILIRPDMRDEAMKFFGRQFVKGIQNTFSEYPMLTKDGQEVWFWQNTRLIVEDGNITGFQVVARDIMDRKRMEAEILALSITDQLTGLHNRRGFLSLAWQQLKLAERNKSRMLLLFADLDGLKWINDTLGHEEGDKSLIEAATVFKETFRTSDIIARLGGDEYAALAVDINEANSEIFTARLQSLIDTRNNQENRRYRLSISVGCSCYDPENPCSIDELMVSADKLMYEQKQNKKGLLLQGASLSSIDPYPSMHDESKDK